MYWTCFTMLSNASIDTLQNDWRPRYVVSQPRSKNSSKEYIQTETPTHKITRALMQIRYDSSKGVGGDFAAARPFWGCIWDLCKCLCEFLCRRLRFWVGCIFSWFETVPQHISGQLFRNLSREVLERVVKHQTKYQPDNQANSGEEKCMKILVRIFLTD